MRLFYFHLLLFIGQSELLGVALKLHEDKIVTEWFLVSSYQDFLLLKVFQIHPDSLTLHLRVGGEPKVDDESPVSRRKLIGERNVVARLNLDDDFVWVQHLLGFEDFSLAYQHLYIL